MRRQLPRLRRLHPPAAVARFRVDKAALAEAHAKELLLLMDVDKTGKISKQEWMKFMEEEFDRLDKDKKGELDQKELMQARVWIKQKPFQRLGK